MTRRRAGRAAALTVVTLGLYGVYWFHRTTDELAAADGCDTAPVGWTLALFVPVVNAVVLWRYARLYGRVTGEKALIAFLLLAGFFPAGQYVVQRGLNTAAGDATTPVAP